MIFVEAESARASLAFERLIPALKGMFTSGCEVPTRHHHAIDCGGPSEATLLLMPAWQAGRYLGIKIVNVFPGNVAKNLPALSSSYLLCDGRTGRHLALIDGNEITSRRTVAASALAVSFLARKDARRLLVVGAGRVASLSAAAHRTVRPINRVAVWDINRDLAERLVSELRGAGIDAVHADDLEMAAGEADIVSCATLATDPLVRGEWLKPGTHLDLIGSFTPGMRETDDTAIRRASVFIDTATALEESGDLVSPLASGALKREDVRATLSSLCRGEHPGRRSADEITLFKSVGTALEDLAAAILVYDDVAGRPRSIMTPG